MSWVVFERVLRVLEFLIILGGIGFTLLQTNEILNNESSRKLDYILRFEDRLFSGKNQQISVAIEHNQPLFEKKKFSDDDLDNYLGTISDIGSAYERRLLTDEDVYENFSDVIIHAYKNKDIQNYLKEIRLEDESYYQEFDSLALHEIEMSQK